MTHLVIGHTTHRSARIWVRAPSWATHAFVTVGDRSLRPVRVCPDSHTAVVEAEGLTPGESRPVEVAFGTQATRSHRDGRQLPGSRGLVQPFPARGVSTRFVFGSCNFPTWRARPWGGRGHGRLRELIEHPARADLVLHVGDQVYFDLPNPWRRPTVENYRRCYRRAWSHDPGLSHVLAHRPNYMIFDDHELVDGFANDRRYWYRRRRAADFRGPALEAYRQMVHARQPHSFGPSPLFYSFSHGAVQFFVLDVRSERWLGAGRAPPAQLISSSQLFALERWLIAHKAAPKFVVSPVPFVFSVRGGSGRRNDKWTGPLFVAQRARLLETIARHRIERLCFLTGDMHTTGQATMEVKLRGTDAPRRVFELMASPLRQLQHGSEGEFQAAWHERHDRVEARSQIVAGSMLGGHDNAMTVTVDDAGLSWAAWSTRRVGAPLRRGEIAWSTSG